MSPGSRSFCVGLMASRVCGRARDDLWSFSWGKDLIKVGKTTPFLGGRRLPDLHLQVLFISIRKGPKAFGIRVGPVLKLYICGVIFPPWELGERAYKTQGDGQRQRLSAERIPRKEKGVTARGGGVVLLPAQRKETWGGSGRTCSGVHLGSRGGRAHLGASASLWGAASCRAVPAAGQSQGQWWGV